jgi:hypothetical protein
MMIESTTRRKEKEGVVLREGMERGIEIDHSRIRFSGRRGLIRRRGDLMPKWLGEIAERNKKVSKVFSCHTRLIKLICYDVKRLLSE